MASWRPGDMVAEITMYVSRVNDDLLGSIRDQITAINTRFEMIEAQAKEYLATGETPPEVIVMLNESVRQDLKSKLVTKHLHSRQATHGVLDPDDPITGSGR